MIAGTAAKGHLSRNSLCNETGIVWHVGCSRGKLLTAMGMTMADRDMLPRTFQANVDRFYQRVILKTLGDLPTHETLVVGETSDLDEFLDRCAAQIDNYTANEAAKAFVLTLDGLFERQLARWARAHGVKFSGAADLSRAAREIAGIDLAAIGVASDLHEMHLAANVARHGDGGACTKLLAKAPQLWTRISFDYHDIAPAPVPTSEELRIGQDDLRRYARAVVQFWGHADPLPGAVLAAPY